MKKIITVILFTLLSNFFIFSNESNNKISLLTSPGHFLFSLFFLGMADNDNHFYMFDLESQIKLNNKYNAAFTLSVLNLKAYHEDIFQVNLKPMLIYRPFNTGLSGFFLNFYPSIGWYTFKNEYKNYLLTEVGIGLNTGYKWIFRNGFSLQLGVGVGNSWRIPKREENNEFLPINSDGRISLNNFDVHIIDFKLGYSF